MSGKKISPSKDSDFNDYANRCIPYLDTNSTRLTIPAATITILLASKLDWNTIYPQAKNPATSTKTLIAKKNTLRAQIKTQLRSTYADIPQSALTDTDRNTLNLKKRDTKSTPRPQITETAYVKINSLNGGMLEIICRTDSDSSRASKPAAADGIELAYLIGTAPPASPADCNKTYFSSKAHFRIDANVVNAGKKLFGYVRFKNNSNPAKSGPWTKLFSSIIAD